MREFSEVMKMFQMLFCVGIAPVHETVKTHQIEHLSFMHFIVSQLCIDLTH